MVNKEIFYKYKKLKETIKQMEKVVVGFSGGVDSTFLLKIAKDELKNNIIAVTVKSPLHFKKEIDKSITTAKKLKAKHTIVEVDLTKIKEIKTNSVDRCYFCKKAIFTEIKKIAERQDIKNVLDAGNVDDLKEYRPGMKALKELGIKSPLIEVGLTKKEIRKLSKQMKLDTWDKPSQTCLATRFPYNITITKPRLKQVEKAESYIHLLGINLVRVRYHNEIVRIEVKKEDFNIILKNSDKITRYLEKIGFKYITLDLNGYRSGVFDKGKKHEKNT